VSLTSREGSGGTLVGRSSPDGKGYGYGRIVASSSSAEDKGTEVVGYGKGKMVNSSSVDVVGVSTVVIGRIE
jgi:hypothetical protein